MELPTGYQSRPSFAETADAPSYGQIAFRMARDSDTFAGRALEPAVFETADRAIAFAISYLDADHSFQGISRAKRERLLRNEARRFQLTEGKEFLRGVGTAGATKLARIGFISTQGSDKYVNLVYIVHGRRNERYFVSGVCALLARDRLVGEMDALVALLSAKSPRRKTGQ